MESLHECNIEPPGSTSHRIKLVPPLHHTSIDKLLIPSSLSWVILLIIHKWYFCWVSNYNVLDPNKSNPKESPCTYFINSNEFISVDKITLFRCFLGTANKIRIIHILQINFLDFQLVHFRGKWMHFICRLIKYP